MLQLPEINQAIQTDPAGYVRACDAAYYEQIQSVAEDIVCSGQHIIFLAGPSSSGKTTTAQAIASASRRWASAATPSVWTTTIWM